MQRSTNSNWNTQQIIRGRPTFVGQYRQAVLQLEDRMANAVSLKHEQRIATYELGLMELECEELRQQTKHFQGPMQKSAELKMLIAEEKMEIQQAKINRCRLSIDENLREVAVCRDELERIKEESGVDFSTLSDEQFQEAMTLESKLFLARNLAASQLSAMTHMPLMACEAWLSHSHIQHELIELKNRMMEEVMPAIDSIPDSLRLSSDSQAINDLRILQEPTLVPYSLED